MGYFLFIILESFFHSILFEFPIILPASFSTFSTFSIHFLVTSGGVWGGVPPGSACFFDTLRCFAITFSSLCTFLFLSFHIVILFSSQHVWIASCHRCILRFGGVRGGVPPANRLCFLYFSLRVGFCTALFVYHKYILTSIM